MPSLRNRKVKGRRPISREEAEKAFAWGERVINEVVGLTERLNAFGEAVGRMNLKPTIDEYVKGKCFGCGGESKGKYCGISCDYEMIARITRKKELERIWTKRFEQMVDERDREYERELDGSKPEALKCKYCDKVEELESIPTMGGEISGHWELGLCGECYSLPK